MVSSKTYTCRLDESRSETIESAVEERDLTRAEVLRNALDFYVRRNPDEIPEFGATWETKLNSEEGEMSRSQSSGQSESSHRESQRSTMQNQDSIPSQKGIYDPTKEWV